MVTVVAEVETLAGARWGEGSARGLQLCAFGPELRGPLRSSVPRRSKLRSRRAPDSYPFGPVSVSEVWVALRLRCPQAWTPQRRSPSLRTAKLPAPLGRRFEASQPAGSCCAQQGFAPLVGTAFAGSAPSGSTLARGSGRRACALPSFALASEEGAVCGLRRLGKPNEAPQKNSGQDSNRRAIAKQPTSLTTELRGQLESYETFSPFIGPCLRSSGTP